MQRISIVLLLLSALVPWGLPLTTSLSPTTTSSVANFHEQPSRPKTTEICSALSSIAPRPAFLRQRIAPLCQLALPGRTRTSLDRCRVADPTSSRNSDSGTVSSSTNNVFRWPTPRQMVARDYVNLAAVENSALRARVFERAESLREESAAFCCQGNEECAKAFLRVRFSLCESSSGADEPDACVFGGNFRMRGSNYQKIFGQLSRVDGVSTEALAVVHRNAISSNVSDEFPLAGEIILGRYLSPKLGMTSQDATIRHELGHACTMIKMQQAAVDSADAPRAFRAVQWLDAVKRRCDPRALLPRADEDYWRTLGETPALAVCLRTIAQTAGVRSGDQQCAHSCPGHLLEEASGIAFALLTGGLEGKTGDVYPNTCDHVRDDQHPLVSDVVDCLSRESARFRRRLSATYACAAAE